MPIWYHILIIYFAELPFLSPKINFCNYYHIILTNSHYKFMLQSNALQFRYLQIEKKQWFCFVTSLVKGDNKKTKRFTFWVAEGVKIIAQQCYTPRWKALDVSFQVIAEPFLCNKHFKRYQWKCKAEEKK